MRLAAQGGRSSGRPQLGAATGALSGGLTAGPRRARHCCRGLQRCPPGIASPPPRLQDWYAERGASRGTSDSALLAAGLQALRLEQSALTYLPFSGSSTLAFRPAGMSEPLRCAGGGGRSCRRAMTRPLQAGCASRGGGGATDCQQQAGTTACAQAPIRRVGSALHPCRADVKAQYGVKHLFDPVAVKGRERAVRDLASKVGDL